MSGAEGLALFDAALRAGVPAPVAARFDLAALRAQGDALAPLFRGMVAAARRRAAAGEVDAGALRQQLHGLGAAEQERVLRELVLRYAAALLGHGSADGVDPERDFLESGFDSLAALRLRNSLSDATGLRLPPMAVFDSKNPAGLARTLQARLADSLEGEGAAAGAGAAPSATAAGPSDVDSLSALFRAAVFSDNFIGGYEILAAVANTRPAFYSPADLPRTPAPVRLADGPARPRLICFSTTMATGGVYQLARMVTFLREPRRAYAVPFPGFGRGESLPATARAAIEVLAQSVLLAAEDEPFVVAGYSAGGVLAYAVAGYLERELGVPPAGVALLDTYPIGDNGKGLPLREAVVAMLGAESAFGRFDSARLSAMGRYTMLLPEIETPRVAAPVLFAQCAEPFYDTSEGLTPDVADWQASPWDETQTVRPLAANHFDMLGERAEATARVVEEWLETLR
jgi:thioesterase domain-containing protein/acyl carrier protein